MAEEKNESKSSQGTKNIFGLSVEEFAKTSKLWQDSYTNLLKSWMGSNQSLFQGMADPSKVADPEKYKEFYEEWIKSYQNTWGSLFLTLNKNAGKEDVQKMMDGAEELNKLIQSWSAELNEDLDKTRKMMGEEPSQETIIEAYKMWRKTYEKIFDDFVNIPASENLQSTFEELTKIPSAYTKTMMEFPKLWKSSYDELYSPFAEEMEDLYHQSVELSKKQADPMEYKELYQKWTDAYNKMFQKMSKSPLPAPKGMDDLMESIRSFSEMYKSWQDALEQMSTRIGTIMQKPMSPEAYEAFYDTWAKTYRKAMEDFIEHMPMTGPMKDMMEPMKNALMEYMDTMEKISQFWKMGVPTGKQGE